jgi:ABC-2 type transport system ATP-binding protein
VTAEPVVSIQHLVKRYGRRAAVDDVSFEIREGEIFGIIGPNGAGKTTTVECISGLRTPDSGSISVYGHSPQSDRDWIREHVGVQLQQSALPPRLGVGEAVELFASFYPDPLDPHELLDSLGIDAFAGATFKSLSGGERQRLSIALALVGNPMVAILDELTTGLDPDARRATWDLIDHVRQRGVTVILVTHFMDEAETLCNRVAILHHGKVAALDTPEAIAAQAGENRVRFVPSRPVADANLRAVPGVTGIVRKDRYITVTGHGDLAASLIDALTRAGLGMSEVDARTGNLEDAFLKLTRQGASSRSGEAVS